MRKIQQHLRFFTYRRLGYPLALSLNFHDSVGVDPCQQRYAAVAARLLRSGRPA